jgi:hypothetical protein
MYKFNGKYIEQAINNNIYDFMRFYYPKKFINKTRKYFLNRNFHCLFSSYYYRFFLCIFLFFAVALILLFASNINWGCLIKNVFSVWNMMHCFYLVYLIWFFRNFQKSFQMFRNAQNFLESFSSVWKLFRKSPF